MEKAITTDLQRALLQAAEQMRADGVPEVHPYALTKMVEDAEGGKRWVGYGSLYRAMTQLTERGFFSTRWEDPALAEAEKRPRRRLYSITPDGQQALRQFPTARRLVTPVV